MLVVDARNVHAALPEGLRLLETRGIVRDSRNGKVVVAPCPVTTLYHKPRERVIFWPERDANPFFHLYESMWMLAGRNEVKSLAAMVKGFMKFSDDGKILHGAYGHRWMNHFGFDQLDTIIMSLSENHDDRRAVLQMWDCTVDLGRKRKDIPCNTQAYFSISAEGNLDMTVCCRSNDIVWGAYGANAVHFSYLQEFVAAGVGVPVGGYWQMSNNYHAYMDTLEPVKGLIDQTEFSKSSPRTNPYFNAALRRSPVEPYPLVGKGITIEVWRQDLAMYLNEGVLMGLREPFFRKVLHPMMMAHKAFKENSGEDKFQIPLEILQRCQASDWRLAGEEWIERRMKRYQE